MSTSSCCDRLKGSQIFRLFAMFSSIPKNWLQEATLLLYIEGIRHPTVTLLQHPIVTETMKVEAERLPITMAMVQRLQSTTHMQIIRVLNSNYQGIQATFYRSHAERYGESDGEYHSQRRTSNRDSPIRGGGQSNSSFAEALEKLNRKSQHLPGGQSSSFSVKPPTGLSLKSQQPGSNKDLRNRSGGHSRPRSNSVATSSKDSELRSTKKSGEQEISTLKAKL